MNYKPSSAPDPDSLSMLIWSKLYFKNKTYKDKINSLFYKTFKNDKKIPGLKLHDCFLHLKTDDPKRQKDFRPVASLASIPKRMLKIIYDHIKKLDKNIFYGKNDYSAPKRGAQQAVFATYERMERGLFAKLA